MVLNQLYSESYDSEKFLLNKSIIILHYWKQSNFLTKRERWFHIIRRQNITFRFFLIFPGGVVWWFRFSLVHFCEGSMILFFFLIVVGFVIHWNESAMDLHVFPIPIPTPTSLSNLSLWVFPVHQVRALVSCIQPGLVIFFTLVNIHVSMLFSWNITPSPSPIDSKRLFYTSVSFSVLHIGLSLTSF